MELVVFHPPARDFLLVDTNALMFVVISSVGPVGPFTSIGATSLVINVPTKLQLFPTKLTTLPGQTVPTYPVTKSVQRPVTVA